MASPFTQAMDTHNPKILGENGSPELASTTDPRLDLFFALVRSLPNDRLQELVKSCFATSVATQEQMAVDMFLLTFQTRDCRGGKGERSLFLSLFIQLAKRYPKTAIDMLPLIPKYGYYKDLFLLATRVEEEQTDSLTPLREAVFEVVVSQLKKDAAVLAEAKAANKKPKDISLLAKWAPREGSAQNALAKVVAQKMFSGSATARAQYRKLVAELNNHLGTVEVKMCGNEWEEIEPTSVPSLTLMRHRKAFLNEKLKGVVAPAQQETGNRFPDQPNRVECRKRIREALVANGVKKLKGKQLFPHEITKLLMANAKNSTVELEIFNAQWSAIRTATQEALAAKRKEAAELAEAGQGAPNVVDLGKLVSIVDVSGSMSGTPMEVAIALGIMVSELADPAFANRIITFHEAPSWCTFEAGASIADKVNTAKRAPWGMSTNFEKAMELILGVAKAAKLNPEEIPNLIVFSDMQFDSASKSCGSWETHHQRLVRRFAETGMEVCGKPWPAPEITYWNLRGDTVGFPTDANAPSVRMLSGFSPSLLKLVMSGEPIVEEVEEEVVEEAVGGGTVVVKKTKVPVNPLATLRKALDDETYDDVRAVLSKSQEGALASYAFTPEVKAETPKEESGAAAMKDEEWEEVENA